MQIRKVQSWDVVERWARYIVDEIVSQGLVFDLVVGIGTGGYIPLCLIAKKLGHEATRTINVRSFVGDHRGGVRAEYFPFKKEDLDGKRVLLIDDIVASGATMMTAKRMLNDMGAEVTTATLVVSSRVCPKHAYPDLSGEEIFRGENEFLCFPWD